MTSIMKTSGGQGNQPSAADLERQRKFQEAMKKKQFLAEQAKQDSAIEKADWKKESMRDLFDPEQKALYDKRKQLAEDVGSGAAARRGAEAGLKAQMAGAGAGRGSAAQRMRGLARAGEAGVKSAAAQGAGAAAQQFGMLGQAGQGRFGMQKSDKAGRLGFYQKSRGLDVAEKAAQAQAAATRAANSGGKASGGEIYKEFKRKNGKIEGPGTETSDDIKAMLSDGEFVVNAKTVRGLGESMGAKGKEDSRKKGAGFLYDLQTKYGDKKPVNKAFGGLEIAELASHAAKEGAFGKKMKTVGEVGSAAVDAKKGIDKKKASDLDAGKKKAEMDELKAFKHKSEKASGEHPSKRAFEQMATGGVIHKPVKATPQDLLKKKAMGGEVEYAKGGDVKFGKGVKAKRKFREAIGWEADKIFDKKVEKDYKEGDTGYKNYKGEKSVTPVKLGRGGLLGSIGRVGLGALQGTIMGGPGVGTAMGAAKAGVSEKVSADKEKAQKKSNIAGAEAQAAAKTGAAGKAMASDEIQLKDGGDVKKDHPHYKYLKKLDEFMARQFPKGKKVDLDPGRKADKAIRAKKGSIEPVELQKGKFIDLSGDKPHEKGMKKGIEKYVIRKLQEKERKARRERGKQRFLDKEQKKQKARIKDTGDAKDLEQIGIINKLQKEERLRKRKAGHKRFIRGVEKREKALIKDTGDAGRAEQIGKKRIKDRKLEAEMADAHLGDAKGLEGDKKVMGIMAKHYQKLDDKKAAEEHNKRQADKRKAYLKAQQEAAADKLVSKGRRETKSIVAKPKEVKKEKSWWGDMPDKDKAGIIMGAGKGLLSARQQYLEAKQKRKEAIAAGESEAAKTRAAAGRQLIAAPVSLRKGGRVSFKDVLKAKKKMGY